MILSKDYDVDLLATVSDIRAYSKKHQTEKDWLLFFVFLFLGVNQRVGVIQNYLLSERAILAAIFLTASLFSRRLMSFRRLVSDFAAAVITLRSRGLM